MIVCENCKGTGQFVSYNDESLKEEGILFETEKCKVCHGSGLIEENYYHWYVEMLSVMEGYVHK